MQLIWTSIALPTMLVLASNAAAVRDGPVRRFQNLAKILPPSTGEPSCEDLRVMWRFSRRQNRLAEMTNELPTHRDPFAYNVWEVLPRTRLLGTLRSGGRSWNRPVYGRIVQNAPKNHPRIANIETTQAYEDVLRYLGNTNDDNHNNRKGVASAFRLTGGLPRPNPISQSGSFQHLKQLIWAERAKELQEQRFLEESVLRNGELKPAKTSNHHRAGYGKQLYDERLPSGQVRYFEEEYAPPRYRSFAAPGPRKSYRYDHVSLTFSFFPILLTLTKFHYLLLERYEGT